MSTGNADTAAPSDPLTPRLYRVGEVRRELSDTVTLLASPLAGPRPAYQPGQFNMLYAFGVGEVAISISGDAGEGGFLHTVRDVGAVSRALANLETGATIGLRGPFGTAWPVAHARGADVIFVAGGLGLAPLRPAIDRVLADRRRYGRVIILFGGRQPKDLLYPPDLQQWRQHLDVDIDVTVDHADADWHGHVGVVPALIRRVVFDPNDTIAMICGPEIMMRFTVSALRETGLSADKIYLSIERNMKCAVGLCGHCQFGSAFVCKDGPVMRFDRIAEVFAVREI